MAKKKPQDSTPIESLKHKDKRANIPTEELRDFVADEEKAPKTVKYPRDPSLDPQLVWRGKDEQDSQDLEVPAVPIYIQEKIRPQAMVEEFRSYAASEKKEQQLDFFDDGFKELDFEQQVEFYQHEQSWENRMVLGDSLLVMNSLAEKERLRGKVQMIYLDPPYGIKFGSNWQVSTRKRDVKDGKADDVTRQPEQVKAFRDTWELGIHSYLAYLRDRLVIARELLTETGSIFIQIGDENVHLVRCLLDEIFGSENFISQISFAKTSGLSSLYLYGICDYILWYSKNKDETKYRQIYSQKNAGEAGAVKYNRIELNTGERRLLSANEKNGTEDIPKNSKYWVDDNLTSQGNPLLEFKYQGKKYQGTYKTNAQGLILLAIANRIYTAESTLRFVRFLQDFPALPINSAWMDIGGIQSRTDPKVYVVQTANEAIKRCLLMTTDPGDLVLDPTCGSGTTAYVAEQWGRRWITVDTSRVALALARTRLMAAKFPYYLLTDSLEGIQKEAEILGQNPTQSESERDIRKGFVYKRVPHVTLKAIANNPEIDTIHAKWQTQLEPIQTALNKLLKQTWEDWQIPRNPEQKWPAQAKDLLTQWWQLKQQRQQEIDNSIASNADTELLYDQPYEDNKRIRVTGPFTVESLSPHRVLSTDEDQPTDETIGQQQASDQFETRIIENLRRAGVQNTKRSERLQFDTLEPYPGLWIHATGEYTEAETTVKRVAISIGPEYGTVSAEQIKEAAKEAVKGIGYDLLIICGFAFDANVSEEIKRYGKLTVLPTRMNADLLLGDELLKKTAAANLFMVFGEPDIEIQHQNDKIIVKLNGVDIYDPTTGEIRSSSVDDIACWFIDTHYNGESFFVRHAYFTGSDRPYDKLKRALKAEIDESAWSDLYSDTSRPFDPPKAKNGKPGKIAVKVINHYGDEVLKVYEIML